MGRALYDANARGQIIDEQASELVHVGLATLRLNAATNQFINTCYNYPTLTEVYKYATYDAPGQRARLLAKRKAAG